MGDAPEGAPGGRPAVRILLASSFSYPRGGDTVQFLAMADRLRDRGHDVAVFSMRHPRNEPSPWEPYWVDNVEYRGETGLLGNLGAFWSSTYSFEARRRMAALLAEFRPNVVHLHNVRHHLTLAVVDAAATARVPVVWTLHDYRNTCPATHLLRGDSTCDRCSGGRFWHGVAGRCKSGSLVRSLAAVTESYVAAWRGTLGKVDCYLSPSEFLAAKVTEMGLPARRLEVLPNPVRALAGRPSAKRPEVLYVGRLSAEKGVGVLLSAVAGLTGVSVRLLGAGPDEGRLRRLADDLGVPSAFEGWVDADGVLTRMSAAALLCVPSVWYENCPTVVLEAMSLGLPVVASATGGLTELLDGGACGRLFAPGDTPALRRTLALALTDEAGTETLAARAKARVASRHGEESFYARLERIYGSVVS